MKDENEYKEFEMNGATYRTKDGKYFEFYDEFEDSQFQCWKESRNQFFLRNYFKELEAKEQEEESSDWVYFEFDKNEVIYRTKDGEDFFYEMHGSCWEKTKSLKDVKEYYESNKDAILKANEKQKQEQPASTTDKLLEVIHKLEKRIEDLEADRSTLVIRTNDIYNRLNSAKLSI